MRIDVAVERPGSSICSSQADSLTSTFPVAVRTHSVRHRLTHFVATFLRIAARHLADERPSTPLCYLLALRVGPLCMGRGFYLPGSAPAGSLRADDRHHAWPGARPDQVRGLTCSSGFVRGAELAVRLE